MTLMQRRGILAALRLRTNNSHNRLGIVKGISKKMVPHGPGWSVKATVYSPLHKQSVMVSDGTAGDWSSLMVGRAYRECENFNFGDRLDKAIQVNYLKP